MRSLLHILAAALLAAASLPASATVFATVHGVVHDPQHRPITGADGHTGGCGFRFCATRDDECRGRFELPQTPIGVYRLTVAANGFAGATQTLEVESGTNPVLHIPLDVAGATQSVVVQRDRELGRHGDADDADHAADDRRDSGR